MTPSKHDFNTDNAVYRTLLESTKAIPFKLDWETKAFSYIGPQIERLLGWAPESWVSVQDWANRMHPDDQQSVVNFCVAQSAAGIDHEIDYRASTKSGSYVWIREVVHIVRDSAGNVESLLGFMFDVTEHKKIEEKLSALHKELEALSYRDGLTGIANRRRFTDSLQQEWDNSIRVGTPLSLVMFDLDGFKQYNDHYGHVAGDECLIKVAHAIQSVGARPRDLTARYGGEEFVLLLPETSADAALEIAERCRLAIIELAIPHAKSEAARMVTVSVGVGGVKAHPLRKPEKFISRIDQALYTAKSSGRNRVELASFEETPLGVDDLKRDSVALA